jgi:hypothetical protein
MKSEMKKVAKAEVKGHEVKMHGAKKMAKGGGIDGCAVKGKTRGTEIKMAKGGMTKKGSRGC